MLTKIFSLFSTGEYLALSGARLDGAEMLACGLATHFVPSYVGSLATSILIKLPNFSSSYDVFCYMLLYL